MKRFIENCIGFLIGVLIAECVIRVFCLFGRCS